MALKAHAERFIEAETRRIAEKIYWEIRAACPKKSGRSARSFRIEKRGRSYAVVSDKLSAYYADQGNGGKGCIIYPRRSKYLKITNGVNKTLGYAKYVHGYTPKKSYIEEVAKRHGK